jgi:hypothetical protein
MGAVAPAVSIPLAGQPGEALAEGGRTFPLVFLSPANFIGKFSRISQYTALTGPLSS